MGPEVVVVMPPGFQFLARMSEAGEDRLVQELVAQARIEAFDKPVLVRLSRRDVVPLDIALLRPAQDRHAGQFGAVIADDRMGACHPLEHGCIKFTPDPRTRDRRVGDQAHALPAVVINDSKDPEPPPTGEGIGYEVEAPALVGPLRDRHRCPRAQSPLAPAPAAHLQPLLTIEPPELLVVHRPSFPTQQPVQPPIAEPPSLAGQFPDTLARLRIVWPTTDVSHHCPIYAQHRAGTALAHLEDLLEMSHRLPPGTGR